MTCPLNLLPAPSLEVSELFQTVPAKALPLSIATRKSKTLGWEKNSGRYGAAQLSNQILYPLDGVSFKSGTNNQMLGYGYCALPLTEPKTTTAGSDSPSGNHCWTLFFQAKNFSGPVCFFTPYHWAKYSVTKPGVNGLCFDSSLLKVNSTYQRETNVVPVKKWQAPDGDTYYRITPYTMAADKDMIGRYGSMPMTIDGTKWNQLTRWFAGDAEKPVSAPFGKIGKEIHLRKSKGGNLAYKIDGTRIKTGDFARSKITKDASAAAFEWFGDLISKKDGLVQIPEYYRLKKGAKSIEAIPVNAVPTKSKLTRVRFPEDVKDGFRFPGFITEPIRTPLHPDYKYRDKIVDAWRTPGPSAGPFVTKLSDGSQAVYYWYKFNEQPAILNSDMDEGERELIQKRVELLHRHWSSKARFFPEPTQKLASLDEGLIVTPPKGMEVGYVPICAHQQKAGQQLPRFERVSR